MSILPPGKRVEASVPMMISRISMPLAMLLALGAPAAAQMYPGQGISVNPAAAAGGKVLLYPGGKYVRVVPQLLQPGQPYPGTAAEPIHLHMPVEQHHYYARQKPEEPGMASAPAAPVAEAPVAAAPVAQAPVAETPIAQAPAPRAPVVQARPAVKHRVAATPPPAPQESADEKPDVSGAAIPFSFGGPRPAVAVKPQAEAAPQPVKAQTKMAAIQPPPAATHAVMTPGEEPANLSKRSEILFPHNGTDPTPEAAGRLQQLAGDLNSALDAGAQRVQLDAFGGAPGDKSTDARRVSLKRALVIRQLLIDDGVPSSRIDIRAMGGIDDRGNADRVDVYVRAG